MWSSWTESIKKRVCRYLLQRYLGQYFLEKLSLDQLSVDIFNGTGTVSHVSLDTCALNAIAEQHNLPLEFVEGKFGTISVSIPWSSIMQNSCQIEVSGMTLQLQPKNRPVNGSSMLESMWTSMASSMQLAEECLKASDFNDDNDLFQDNVNPLSGLEHCAQTIDAVLSRVKICFNNTVIRIVPDWEPNNLSIAFEVRIQSCKYLDSLTEGEDQQNLADTAFYDKKVVMEGISCFIDVKCAKRYELKNTLFEHGLIQIGRFNGRHIFKVKIKKDDTIRGPQVSVECNFGSFVGYIYPFQLHILIKLLEVFAYPLDGKLSSTRKLPEKPMDIYDFSRIETELQEQLKPGSIGIGGQSCTQKYGWSYPIREDSDEDFRPFRGDNLEPTGRIDSSLINSSKNSIHASLDESVSDNSLSCSTTSALFGSITDSPKMTNNSKQFEMTSLTISCASVCLILLERDILRDSGLLKNDEAEDKPSSEEFFEKLGPIGISLSGKKDEEGVHAKLDTCCSLSHLRLTAAPVKLQGVISLHLDTSISSGYFSVGYFQLNECLKREIRKTQDPAFYCIDLLTFPNYDKSAESVRFELVQEVSSSFSTKSKLKIQMKPCFSEVDISILDRIHGIFNSSLDLEVHRGAVKFRDSQSQNRSVYALKLLLQIPQVSINFRFPVPMINITTDRNVRQDYLNLVLKNTILTTFFNSSIDNLSIETKCQEMQIFYKEGDNKKSILIAEASCCDSETELHSLSSRKIDWPRLIVSLRHGDISEPFRDEILEDEDETFDSIFDMAESSPFSCKRTVREGRNSSEVENTEYKENVEPGNREEIDKFMENTAASSKWNIQLDLNTANVILPSKHVFEQLYNRISVDLLLWEPLYGSDTTSLSRGAYQPSMFQNCKAVNYESENIEDDEVPSFFAPKISNKHWFRNQKKKLMKYMSKISVNISVRKGSCIICTQYCNEDGIPDSEKKGQAVINLSHANIFIVSNFKGNQDLGYVCAFARTAELLHLDLISCETQSGEFNLRRTIYSTGDEFKFRDELKHKEPKDMLTVAMKIDRENTTNIKTFKVAAVIASGTLNHSVCLPNCSWLSQIFDFFDVQDIPVPGYTPASIIVEFHLHLLECILEYSPKFLPLRSLITIDSFTISSNITTQAKTSILQIILEDAALFITNDVHSSSLLDYICVMELDILELSLRFSKDATNVPSMDLLLSNNRLNIRTCSDTFKALRELFSYFAMDGDLEKNEKEIVTQKADIKCQSECIDVHEGTLYGDTNIPTDVQVAEAMNDNTSLGSNVEQSRPNRNFNFGENLELERYVCHMGHENYSTPAMPLFEPRLECASPVNIDLSDDDVEDFCILENDPGVGILAASGEPEARVLTNERIRLVENHFAFPNSKIDVLKAPKHYPVPVMRYTIQEITVVWDLYDGQDFISHTIGCKESSISGKSHGSKNNLSDREEVCIAKSGQEFGVSFGKSKAFESAWEAYQQPKVHLNFEDWRSQGGKRRNRDICVELLLSKLKFQYEVYPTNAEQSSRQVLVVNSLEVKDKLLSSEFNKMLYLYTSNANPRQSRANMIVIKLVHTRTDPDLNIDECSLKMSVLPIRLNIDQDALLFLYKFHFESQVQASAEQDIHANSCTEPSQSPIARTARLVDESSMADKDIVSSEREEALLESGNFLLDDRLTLDAGKKGTPVYFREIVVVPEIPLRLDYRGKRLDLTHGPLTGILMGLAQLNCSEIRLRRINYSHGILGVDKLIKHLISEWSNDITKNQLPSLLGGVGPIHSFVQLFQGVRDLFWLPIEQYHKDGRIAKGIQRGANSFSNSTAMAALEITNRMVLLIQGVAEFTYDLVSPGPSVHQQRRGLGRKKRHAQAGDFRQGMSNAYQVVKEGLGDTAKNIVHVASREHEQKGVSGAVGGVLRQLPPTVVHPIILVAEATSSVLDGFRSELEPEYKKHSEEKWKGC